MRFMIIVKSTPEFETEDPPQAPAEQLLAAMDDYHRALSEAGVLLDASGLQPSRKGWRIQYGADDRRTVIDGPFAEAKELIAGFTIIQVRSREEAMAWSQRFPNPVGEGRPAVIEVRELFNWDDAGQADAIDASRAIEAPPWKAGSPR